MSTPTPKKYGGIAHNHNIKNCLQLADDLVYRLCEEEDTEIDLDEARKDAFILYRLIRDMAFGDVYFEARATPDS